MQRSARLEFLDRVRGSCHLWRSFDWPGLGQSYTKQKTPAAAEGFVISDLGELEGKEIKGQIGGWSWAEPGTKLSRFT